MFGYHQTNNAEWESSLWLHKSCPKNYTSTKHSLKKKKKYDIIYSLAVYNALQLHRPKKKYYLSHYSLLEYIIAMRKLSIYSFKLSPFKMSQMMVVYLHIRHMLTVHHFFKLFSFHHPEWYNFLFIFLDLCFSSILTFHEIIIFSFALFSKTYAL